MEAPRAEYLILGGAGLVGSALRAALSGRSVASTWHHQPVPGGIPLDIADAEALRRVIRDGSPRVVLVAAAEAYVERCEKEPDETRRVNVEPVRVLAEECARLDIGLVVFSSEYVFDGTRGMYSEHDPVGPLNEYGRQKVNIERIASGVRRHLVCRTSGVFGWEDARKNFVCALIDTLRSGRPFTVPADQLITPTYAPALGRAVVALLDRGVTGVIHTCGPRVINRLDFAREAAAAFDLPAELVVGRSTAALGLAAPRPPAAGLSDAKLAVLGGGLPDPVLAFAEMKRTEPVR